LKPSSIALLASLSTLAGCAPGTSTVEDLALPAGTYEIYRADQPAYQKSPSMELIVSETPLDLSPFSEEAMRYAKVFGDRPPTACVVQRFTDEQYGSTTSLSFDRPEATSNGWKIRTFETHHFWSWLLLAERDGRVMGTAEQTGWGGPYTTAIRGVRVSDPDPQRCVRAGSEIHSE